MILLNIWDKIDADIREQYGDDREYKHTMLVAANISRTMKMEGLTEHDLSKIMRKSLPYINKCLSGNYYLTTNEIISFAKALKIEPHVLLKPYNPINT